MLTYEIMNDSDYEDIQLDTDDLVAIEKELGVAVKVIEGARRGVLTVSVDDLTRYDKIIRQTLVTLHRWNRLIRE